MPTMMQAAPTVSNEKPPSVGALKGFEIVLGGLPFASVVALLKGFSSNTMTSIEIVACDAHFLSHDDTLRSRAKCAARTLGDVMVHKRITAWKTAAP